MKYKLKSTEGFEISNKDRGFSVDVLNSIPLKVGITSLVDIPTNDTGDTISSTDANFTEGFSFRDSWLQTDEQWAIYDEIYEFGIVFDLNSDMIVSFSIVGYDANENEVPLDDETLDHTVFSVQKIIEADDNMSYERQGIVFNSQFEIVDVKGVTKKNSYELKEITGYVGNLSLIPNKVVFSAGNDSFPPSPVGLNSLTLNWKFEFGNRQAYHYYGSFKSAQGMSLTLPSGVSYIGSAPTFADGHVYQYHIFNGYIDFIDLTPSA